MKTLDFSKNGGFPLTQDALNFMQQGYQEPLKALAAMGGTGPFIISGMVEAAGNVSNGTLYYQNEIIPFVGGAVGVTIVIQTYSTTLQYGDSNNYAVQTRKEATFGTGPVQFNYADLKTFQEGFGLRSRTGWLNLPSGTGQFYHDKLTNSVTVAGSFEHSQFEYGPDHLPEMMPAATVPAGLSSSKVVWFRTIIETHHLPIIKTAEGTVYTSESGRLFGTSIAISSRTLLGGMPMPTHNFYFTYQL